MTEYIERDALLDDISAAVKHRGMGEIIGQTLMRYVKRQPAADVAPVVRCKGCKHSTLPSEPTQRYGKPGTLTCHNMHAPSNRRNVGSNDFCSCGEPKDGGASNG